MLHCNDSSRAGVSRSATIVTAFVMFHHRLPLSKALAHVSERRKVVSPNQGFMEQLKEFERELVQRGHVPPQPEEQDDSQDEQDEIIAQQTTNNCAIL